MKIKIGYRKKKTYTTVPNTNKIHVPCSYTEANINQDF